MNFPYTDDFFSVDSEHGFLPIKDPLKVLPYEYNKVQSIIDLLPILIHDKEKLQQLVLDLPNYLVLANSETDIFVIQALFRAYTFITSAYLLQPAFLHQDNGKYGKGRTELPENIVLPLECVSSKLDVFPWLDYHYAYSLGNYVKKDPTGSFDYTNLEMACCFSGTSDETGFIMVHVDINSNSPNLIRGIELTKTDPNSGLKLILDTMKIINERRKTMWKASNHKNYNNFRAFIMGIKGNTEIFGSGVEYSGSPDQNLRTYRGQSGSQDDIIPTVDIFSGLFKYYPDNVLTQYLLDMRQYRPKVVQNFFSDLEQNYLDINLLDNEGLKYLYLIQEEVHNFRNGHWMFVQKYIMENTKYQVATGGTPITTWIPNQIEAVLNYMNIILEKITDSEFIEYKKTDLGSRCRVLFGQIEELRKVDYNVELVYELEGKYKEH
jgi:indoleamine 2,3-dioxygenase